MKIVDVEQGSPEWLEARRGLATASCFCDILAGGKKLMRDKYRLRLVLERLTGTVAPTFENFATRQGQEREPLARAAYEHRKRVLVRQVGFCRHDTLEAGASPDGFVGADGLFEAKCPEPLAHCEIWESQQVPTEYWSQVQGELWICERRWLDFVSWSPDVPPDMQLVVVRVERDAPFIDRLRTAVPAFMEEVRSQEGRWNDIRKSRSA